MLHIALLGEQTITDDTTGGVEMPSWRSIALVAYLVVHANSPQPRQHIAGLFWPDSTDAQALTNLRRELHHLRRVLRGEAALVVAPKHLCWQETDTCRVDARTFDTGSRSAFAAAEQSDNPAALRQATAALAAYGGELLPGGYDDWLVDIRADLEQRCINLCDLICAVGARTGELRPAVDAARRRIQIRPLEEVGYQTLIELQLDLGDRAGAISTYHHCVSVLERELGVEPAPQTKSRLDRLLESGEALVTGEARAERTTVRAGIASARLVGRSRELNHLRARWEVAESGHPGLTVVSGEAGVGKSRLVSEVTHAARASGALVASTQCFGVSGRLPLAPVADWLRDPAVRATWAGLEPVWRAEVDRLVPSASGRGIPAVASRARVDAWQQHRFFEGLARALTSSPRPLLLVLDNVQWCDQQTLTFLSFCLRFTPDAPLMVAATMRNDDPDAAPELAHWMTHLRAGRLLSEVRLNPLPPADTVVLAEALSGRTLDEGAARLLQATTGGFPLYVVEASRSTVSSQASSVISGDFDAVLRQRLEQTTRAGRATAALAAAVGRDFTLDLLTEASDLVADEVVRAVDELWRHRILRELSSGYDFSHDLLRAAAYGQTTPPQRWLLHRRLAQALELLHADRLDQVAAQLADQYARGGVTDRAVAYYRKAAEVAAGTFAHAEAIRLHRQALTIVEGLPDGSSRDAQELAIVEAMTAPTNALYGYSSPQLQQATERSLALAEELGRKNSILTSLIGLWTSRFVQGRVEDGLALATRALAMVERGSETSGQAHLAFGGSALTLGRPAEALRHFVSATESANSAPSLTVGTKPAVHALAWAAHGHWLLGDDEEAWSACRDAVTMAREAEHPYSLAVALAFAAITYQLRGDLPELRATVDELRALCDRYGFAYYREWGLLLDGWQRKDASGLVMVRRAIDNLKTEHSLVRMPYWLALLADLLANDGQPGAASAALDAALVDAQAHRDLWWLPEVMRMRAAYDDRPHAERRLRAAAALADDHGSVAHVRRCLRDLDALVGPPPR